MEDPDLLMRLRKSIERDVKAAKKIWLPWWAVLTVMAVCMPIIFVFNHFARLNLFMPAAMSVAVLAFAIYVKRDFIRFAWFWSTIILIAVLHAVLILLIPWTDKWVPAFAFAGAASLDLVVIFAVIEAIAKVVDKRAGARGAT